MPGLQRRSWWQHQAGAQPPARPEGAMAAGAKFGAARGVCPVSSWLLCEPSPRRGPVHPPPLRGPGTWDRSRPLVRVSGGGGWCVSEEASLLSHAHLKKEKKIIIMLLMLHLLVCPAPCCVPRTPPRRQPCPAAPGFPRVLATARFASAGSLVLPGVRR